MPTSPRPPPRPTAIWPTSGLNAGAASQLPTPTSYVDQCEEHDCAKERGHVGQEGAAKVNARCREEQTTEDTPQDSDDDVAHRTQPIAVNEAIGNHTGGGTDDEPHDPSLLSAHHTRHVEWDCLHHISVPRSGISHLVQDTWPPHRTNALHGVVRRSGRGSQRPCHCRASVSRCSPTFHPTGSTYSAGDALRRSPVGFPCLGSPIRTWPTLHH